MLAVVSALCLCLGLAACSDESNDETDGTSNSETATGTDTDLSTGNDSGSGDGSDTDPVPKGTRVLEIQVNQTADGEFIEPFNTALAIGVDSQTFSVDWTQVESGLDADAQPVYLGSVGSELLSIANACYPKSNTQVSMLVRPVLTLARSVPEDLAELPLSSPALIARFNAMMNHLLSRIPDIDITALAIGSEVDLFLNSAERRAEFATFYAATAEHARQRYASLYPGRDELNVTTEVTHRGLLSAETQEYYQELLSVAKSVGVSYYPLDNGIVQDPSIIESDFQSLIALYPAKKLAFFQLGYPSGYYSTDIYPELASGRVAPVIGSSGQRQAQFIEQTFRAWDRHADNIDLISFTWMHDLTEAAVLETTSNPAFGGTSSPAPDYVEFLRTLGLRGQDGADKPAFDTFRDEAMQRGWVDSGARLSCD